MNKWEIFLADLEPVIGSEQGKVRPVIIISEDSFNRVRRVLNVIPLTSLKEGRKIYPNEVLMPEGIASLPKASVALIHQIRTLDKSRMLRKMGMLTDSGLQESVFRAIRAQFGMWES